MTIPPPDISQAPQFGQGLSVIEVMYSDDQQLRVSITKDDSGLYRVHPERWDISDIEYAGYAYWNTWNQVNSITDDLEIARKMARQALSSTPRSESMPYVDE